MNPSGRQPSRRSLALQSALGCASALAFCACSSFGAPAPPAPTPVVEAPECHEAVFQRASLDKSAYLELAVARLREDLSEAEATMVAIESGMRNEHTRADAVSALAEARIAVERASGKVPWRSDEFGEALHKMEEAERELKANHTGTAIFFASRARRIAETLFDEGNRIAASPDARFIRARRVNLRAGPSTGHAILDVLSIATPVILERPEGEWLLVRTLDGQVGWIHGQLVR